MKKLLTFTLLIFIQHLVFAQNRPPLERIISLKISNERLDNALKSISMAGNFSFSYNPDEIIIEKRVSINVQNQSIREILSDIFENTISFKNRGNYIILKKISDKPQEDFFVMGYVSDGETGLKIEKASIYEPVTLASAVSNQYGYYRLKIPRELANVNILVRKQNYQDERILIKNRQDKALNIKLLALKPIQNTASDIKLISFKIDTLPNKKLDSLPLVKPAISNISVPEMKDSVIIETPKFDYKEQLANAKEKWNITQKRLTNWIVSADKNIHLDNIQDTIYRPFQMSLLPFIGTNFKLSGNVINDISINVIAGYSLGVRKLELGSFLNVVRGDVAGLQASGFANLVGKDVKGIQLGSFANIVGRNVSGIQSAGFGNLNLGKTQGIQLGGFGNIVLDSFDGLQAAGFVNIIGKDAKKAIQMAGFSNIASENYIGLQVAGFNNFVRKDYKGSQISGFINTVSGTLSGLQISVINFTKKANNVVQIGVVNVAGEAQNLLPIGVLSFVRKGGYKCLELSTDEVNLANLSFKTGVNRLYNILTVGYNFGQTKSPLFSYGYGLGTLWKLNKIFGVNLDVVSSHLQTQNNRWNLNQLTKINLGLEIRPTKHLSIFVAPTYNFLASNESNIDLGKLSNNKIINRQLKYWGENATFSTWVGIQGGVRLF